MKYRYPDLTEHERARDGEVRILAEDRRHAEALAAEFGGRAAYIPSPFEDRDGSYVAVVREENLPHVEYVVVDCATATVFLRGGRRLTTRLGRELAERRALLPVFVGRTAGNAEWVLRDSPRARNVGRQIPPPGCWRNPILP